MLIVVTDNVQAKMFRVEDRIIELVHTISKKPDRLDRDREAVRTGSGDMRSAEPEDDSKTWSREHLYNELSAELMKRLQNKEFERLAFTVPEENKDELQDCLHIDLLKRTDVFIPKLLTNEEPLDIAAYIQEEM